MRIMFLKIIAIFLLVAMFSGCATMSDSSRTKAEGTGFGALLGSALGAGIGALAGGGKGAAIGAGIGALVGGAGGYAWGSSVAERKAKYANEEDRLDGEINVVAGYNNDLQAINDKTAHRIGQLEQQVAALNSQYEAGNVQVSVLERKQREINSLVQNNEKIKGKMDDELVALNAYQDSIAQTQDQQKVAKLSNEIDTLKKNIATLDDGNKQMAQLVSSLTVRR